MADGNNSYSSWLSGMAGLAPLAYGAKLMAPWALRASGPASAAYALYNEPGIGDEQPLYVRDPSGKMIPNPNNPNANSGALGGAAAPSAPPQPAPASAAPAAGGAVNAPATPTSGPSPASLGPFGLPALGPLSAPLLSGSSGGWGQPGGNAPAMRPPVTASAPAPTPAPQAPMDIRSQAQMGTPDASTGIGPYGPGSMPSYGSGGALGGLMNFGRYIGHGAPAGQASSKGLLGKFLNLIHPASGGGSTGYTPFGPTGGLY